MGRGAMLVKNTVVLMIGNFASKLLIFFLLPLYTHYLSNAEYGEFDIYINILAIAYCVVSFQSIEVIYRYIQDCKEDYEYQSVISNAFTITILGICTFAFAMFGVYLLWDFKYWFIFILYTSTNILAQFCQQCIRGMNKMVLYSTVGVIATLTQVLFNILFIVVWNMGGVSMLWAHVCTFIAIFIIILYKCNIFSHFSLQAISIPVIKEQLKYGIPLMPNAVCLWGISSLGRYLLLLFYTTAAVGILAFASKFSLLLGVVNSVFFLAWQQSAITEYASSDRDQFASSIFDKFAKLQISGIAVFLPLIKVLIFTVMGQSYREGWVYVPLFFIGIMFNAYANFVSMGFFGAKKTNSVFYASFAGIIIYVLLGYFGAKYWYIYGVGVAYVASQLVYFIMMKITGRKYLNVKIDYKSMLPVLIILSISLLTYYTTHNIIALSAWCALFVFAAYFNNAELVQKLLKLTSKKQ